MRKSLALSCIATLGLTVCSVSASTLYVSKEPNQVVKQQYYTKIQDAINKAKQGDTVYVYPGRYEESLKIEKSLSLMGHGDIVGTQGASENAATIDGGTNIAAVSIGTTTNISVTLQNLNIVNGKNGIHVLQNTVATIDRNTVTGYEKNGITFGPVMQPGHGGVRGTITKNRIIGRGLTDQVAQNGIQIAEDNTAVIEDNYIRDHLFATPGTKWATGIIIYRTKSVTVANNMLTNNQAAINIQQAKQNTVERNTILSGDNSKAGVMISSHNNILFPTSENSVSGNTIQGGDVGIWISYANNNSFLSNTISKTKAEGILSWDSDKNVISNNFISALNLFSRNMWALALRGGEDTSSPGSDENTISNNSIQNSLLGIDISKNSENNKVEGNSVRSFWAKN